MSEAIECERCGEFESRGEWDECHPERRRGDLSAAVPDRDDYITADLCRRCRESLLDWLDPTRTYHE